MEWDPREVFDVSKDWFPPSTEEERENEFELIRAKIKHLLEEYGWFDDTCLLGWDGEDRTIHVILEPFELPGVYQVPWVEALFEIIRNHKPLNFWRIRVGWGHGAVFGYVLCSLGWSVGEKGGGYPDAKEALECELMKLVDRYGLQVAYSEKFWAWEKGLVRKRFLGDGQEGGPALVVRYRNKIPFVGEAMGDVRFGFFDPLADCFSVWAFFPWKGPFDFRECPEFLEWEDGKEEEIYFRAYVRSGENEKAKIPEELPGQRCAVIVNREGPLGGKREIRFFPNPESYVDLEEKEGVVFNFIFESLEDIRKEFVFKKENVVHRVPVDFHVVDLEMDFRPDWAGDIFG